MILDRIALTIAIAGCIYLGVAGLLNIELLNPALNHPACLLKRFIFAMTGASGIWCSAFFFKFKNKKPIEI